jgi:hypothetical protein
VDKIRIGEEAKRVLANESVQEAFKELEEFHIGLWKQAETTEVRERQWHMLEALTSLKQLLNTQTQRGIQQAKQGRRGNK